MLIIGVGIMYLQSRYIRTSDYGYDKDVIITGNMTTETQAQNDAVVNDLSRIPGVKGVAFSMFILSSADNYMNWAMDDNNTVVRFDVMPVDYHFLDVMGIHITEGRNFKPGDGDVYIFNEATRKKYPWLKVGQTAPDDHLIVGFCENIKYSSFRNDDNTQPMAFFIYGKNFERIGHQWQQTINIRVSAGVNKIAIIQSLQKTMEKFTPGHDFNFRFMDEVLDANYRNELRFTKQILLFSLIAIAISLTGVFGLTMFESEYRRKEIGIRKIMGSSTRQILYMFNRRYILICHQPDRSVRTHHVRERIQKKGNRNQKDYGKLNQTDSVHVQPKIYTYTYRMLHRGSTIRMVDRTALAARICRENACYPVDIHFVIPAGYTHNYDYYYCTELEKCQ